LGLFDIVLSFFYVFGMKGVRVLVQNDGSWTSSKIDG